MIKNIVLQPETDDSHLFMSAKVNAGLDRYHYLEEEYFFTGTANVYGKGETGDMTIVAPEAPYTNRFVVRRPADPAAASGRVVVEIVNSSSYMDIDRSWVLTCEQLMRNGDIYVGVTSKPITMKTLRKFDPQRYAPLNWGNPRKCLLPAEALGNFEGASRPETEDGLFWDMLTDLGLACRGKNCFLGGAPVKRVYLMGWSQSGGYMVAYTNWFARKRYEAGLTPVFDGMFSMGPGPSVTPALNQEESMRIDQGEATVQFSNVPYYTVHTESENAGLGTCQTRIPDSDDPQLLYRITEIAGATHDSVFSMDDYYRDRTDQRSTSVFLTYPGYEPNPNNFPYQLAYHAGLMHLYDWVEQGVTPPKNDPIPVRADLENETDENGNARGGWRLPEIELPVCTYKRTATPLKPGFSTLLYGCELPFSAEKLRRLYGSLANYRALVRGRAQQAVAERRLVAEDLDYCVEHAVAKAEKYGLV